jgi:hypothetical protein
MTTKSQKPKHRVKLGIDPGTHTGIALAVDGKLTQLYTSDFWECYDWVRDTYLPGEIEIHIEDTNDLPVIDRGASWRSHGKIGKNIGSVCREASLLISGFRRLGYAVVCRDQKRTPKLDAETFRRLTGWEGRTNSHMRDAAVLVFGL